MAEEPKKKGLEGDGPLDTGKAQGRRGGDGVSGATTALRVQSLSLAWSSVQ